MHEVNEDKKGFLSRFKTNYLFIEKMEKGEKLPYYLWGKYRKYLYRIPSKLAKKIVNRIHDTEKEVKESLDALSLSLLGGYFYENSGHLTQKELDEILEQAVKEYTLPQLKEDSYEHSIP